MRIELYDANALNFVELNITGGNETLIRCDRESKFVDSIVFNLFAPCFENANKLYEYYGPTKYNSRKIIPLRNELIKYREELEKLSAADSFEEFVSSHFLGKEFIDELTIQQPEWKKSWKKFKDNLIKITQEMVDLTEKCADEERILWVVGY